MQAATQQPIQTRQYRRLRPMDRVGVEVTTDCKVVFFENRVGNVILRLGTVESVTLDEVTIRAMTTEKIHRKPIQCVVVPTGVSRDR